MDRTERFYKIERMLRNREVVPIRDLLDELGVSEATFKRDIEYLRERLNAPIPWDREKRGYRLYDPDPENPRHELPGLWFNSSEIHALLAFHHLLDRLQSGLLTPHIAPLKKRIQALIEKDDRSFAEVARRIRVLPQAARHIESPCFQSIAHEQWHPKQKGYEKDGAYTLEVPYSDDTELILDILRYGPDVEVLAPASLRREVTERLRLAAQRYNDAEKRP